MSAAKKKKGGSILCSEERGGEEKTFSEEKKGRKTPVKLKEGKARMAPCRSAGKLKERGKTFWTREGLRSL